MELYSKYFSLRILIQLKFHHQEFLAIFQPKKSLFNLYSFNNPLVRTRKTGSLGPLRIVARSVQPQPKTMNL